MCSQLYALVLGNTNGYAYVTVAIATQGDRQRHTHILGQLKCLWPRAPAHSKYIDNTPIKCERCLSARAVATKLAHSCKLGQYCSIAVI